jgi:hypothetical protein
VQCYNATISSALWYQWKQDDCCHIACLHLYTAVLSLHTLLFQAPEEADLNGDTAPGTDLTASTGLATDPRGNIGESDLPADDGASLKPELAVESTADDKVGDIVLHKRYMTWHSRHSIHCSCVRATAVCLCKHAFTDTQPVRHCNV